MTEVCGIGTALTSFLSDVKLLVDSPNVDAIMINNNSPGGHVEGVNEGANLLATWGKEKPIVTYTSNQNASASYWLTSKAGKIYGDATASFGSIGVMASTQSENDQSTLTFISSKSPMKNADPKTKEGRTSIMNRIDAIADIFIESVAEGRGIGVDKVEKDFGKGDVLIGKEAVSAGMIDGLSSFEELFQKYSTEASTNYITNYKGEDNMELTLETLKAKFPQVHQQACDEAVNGIQSTVNEKNKIIKALEDQVVALEGQVETAGLENATLATRLTVLEKENEIQKVKAAEQILKSSAKKIADECLSDLPTRIQSKVTGLVNYNSFVDDKGVFDEAKYKEALVAEASDFAAILSPESSLSGLASGGNRDEADSGDDTVVNRMLAAAGITV
jgi:ClpP class serine protease